MTTAHPVHVAVAHPVLRVVAPGPLTTVQDLGRPGLAHLGVPGSGAADRPSAALANRLVGNPADAAVLEVTGGGLTVSVLSRVALALTGAVAAVTVDGLPLELNRAVLLRPGSTLAVAPPTRGLRTYLGVRGGVEADVVLGSRSRDVLSGLGPPPLAAGDLVAVGPQPDDPPQEALELRPPPVEALLDVLPGPRPEWFETAALATLCRGPYRVTDDVNRVGARLAGAPVPWAEGARPFSEGLVDGAVQVPPDGAPLVFLADHPVTGGYPVVAVLTEASLAAAAQLSPGDTVRFRTVGPGRVGGHH